MKEGNKIDVRIKLGDGFSRCFKHRYDSFGERLNLGEKAGDESKRLRDENETGNTNISKSSTEAKRTYCWFKHTKSISSVRDSNELTSIFL